MFDDLRHQRFEHRAIGRLDADHAGDAAHDAHILKGHMGAAVDLGGDAGICADDLDVLFAVSDRDEDLVIAATGRERAERGAEGDLAAGRKPGGNADHIRLGDAYVEEAVGVRLLERTGLDAIHQVRLDDDDPRVGRRHFDQAVAIYFAHLFDILHISPPPCRRIRATRLRKWRSCGCRRPCSPRTGRRVP